MLQLRGAPACLLGSLVCVWSGLTLASMPMALSSH